MSSVPHSPSPLAGEGLGCGDASRRATQKTLAEVQARRKWLVQKARDMRANPTDAERTVWNLIRGRQFSDLRWRRQQIIDEKYIVDFICFEHRLIIEADGGQHSGSEEDQSRDQYLRSQGFSILRFWNNEILTNIEGVSESILYAIKNNAVQPHGDPTPNPLPQGERALNGVSV